MVASEPSQPGTYRQFFWFQRTNCLRKILLHLSPCYWQQVLFLFRESCLFGSQVALSALINLRKYPILRKQISILRYLSNVMDQNFIISNFISSILVYSVYIFISILFISIKRKNSSLSIAIQQSGKS